jgi:hypothetical protein
MEEEDAAMAATAERRRGLRFMRAFSQQCGSLRT